MIKKIFFLYFQTNFEDGEVVLTTHRLFWGYPGEISNGERVLCLQLMYVISLDEELASSFVFGKKKRIIMHLKSPVSGLIIVFYFIN